MRTRWLSVGALAILGVQAGCQLSQSDCQKMTAHLGPMYMSGKPEDVQRITNRTEQGKQGIFTRKHTNRALAASDTVGATNCFLPLSVSGKPNANSRKKQAPVTRTGKMARFG